MADPVGWLAPVVTWTPARAISETDFNRIENNILLIKNRIWGLDGSFDAVVDTPYFTAKVTVTITYRVINGVVFLDIPTGFESPALSTNTELQLEPDTTWPSDILPSVATKAKCIFKHNGADANNFDRPGYMLIPTGVSDNIVCYITLRDLTTVGLGCYNATAFYESGGITLRKAIPRQTISYILETAP